MVNEKRLIDANELLELYDMGEGLEDYASVLSVPIPVIRQNIKDMPTVDAVEVVHGRWENSHGIYSCSVCGKSNPYEVLGDSIWYWPCNYCPNCGADMR